jgi:hypothetical protein
VDALINKHRRYEMNMEKLKMLLIELKVALVEVDEVAYKTRMFLYQVEEAMLREDYENQIKKEKEECLVK